MTKSSNLKFLFGETLNCLQVGNGYLEFDIRNRKADNNSFIVANDNTNEVIGLVKNAFALTIHDSTISTSAGTEMEQNKLVGPLSFTMRLLTQRDGDLSTYFDVIDESETDIKYTSLKQILNNHHTEAK